jgi:hypothetical protein
MKNLVELPVTEQFELATNVIGNGGAILGTITFCDDTYPDFDSLKDAHSIDPEINVFAIIHKVNKIIQNSKNLTDDCENALSDNDSYIIPSQYCGSIVLDMQ